MVNWPNSDTLTQDILSRKQAKAMFWHLLIAAQIVWIRVCFLCRGKKSRARTTSGPGDRITPNMAVLHIIFFFPSPFPLLSHNPWHASAPRIGVMFWVMISSLLWLSSSAARRASNTQVVGEMSCTPRHTSSPWRLCMQARQRAGLLLDKRDVYVAHVLAGLPDSTNPSFSSLLVSLEDLRLNHKLLWCFQHIGN